MVDVLNQSFQQANTTADVLNQLIDSLNGLYTD
jgi:hypothetical protein